MSTRFAVIKDNIVENVRVSNAVVPSSTIIILQSNEPVGPGWKYYPNQVPRFKDERPKLWTSYEFLNRFTKQERTLIRAKAKSDDNVADFEMLRTAAQDIISNDPVTIAGMDYLVSVNVITAQRKSQILGEV